MKPMETAVAALLAIAYPLAPQETKRKRQVVAWMQAEARRALAEIWRAR